MQTEIKSDVYFFEYDNQNNPKDLDPSCKMDLDLWDYFGREKHLFKLSQLIYISAVVLEGQTPIF